jgi:hypothetical protein
MSRAEQRRAEECRGEKTRRKRGENAKEGLRRYDLRMK